MGQAAQETTAAGDATILVVEDDASIRDVLINLLAGRGFDVVTAASGERALELAGRSHFDLVLLDLMLPDVSGYDVCARLREQGDSGVPIAMLTALGAKDNVVAGLAHGADEYIVKPFDPRELLLRVEGLLRRAQRVRSAESALEQATERADAALVDAARERIMRHELIHSVTTHMRTLSQVADVAVRRFPDGPLREQVEQLRLRIRGATLTYVISEMLQHEPVDAQALLQTIASSLKDLYRPWRRVVVKVVGPPLDLSANLAAPLALIMNEIITNALRHAFPDMRWGTLTISYAAEDDKLVFTVADNGVGLGSAASRGGRGRRAVKALVQELDGQISWISDAGGTRVEGRLPLNVASGEQSGGLSATQPAA